MQSLVELIAFFPLTLMMAVFSLPDSVVLYWLAFLPVYCIIGLLLRTALKKKPRMASALIGMTISFFLAYKAFGWGFPLWLSYIAGAVLLFRGMAFAERGWEEVFPIAALWVGMLAYFVAYFFFKHVEELKPYSFIITWMGFIHIAISLFIFNSQQLKKATLARENDPVLSVGLLRHNRLLIGVAFILIGVIANFKYLKQAVLWLVNAIIILIFRIVLFLSSLIPMSDLEGGDPQGNGMLDVFPEAQPRDPNIFDYIFEILAYILTIACMVVLFIVIVKILYTAIKKLINLLATLLHEGEWSASDRGYVDIKEKVTDLKTLGKDYAKRWKDWLTSLLEREPRWEELPGVREKVRYLYRHFLIRCISQGYNPEKYMTPNEIKEDIGMWDDEKGRQANVLVPLYNFVRYGRDTEDMVDSEKLDQMARDIRR
jgi:hypothetical protein